MQPFFKFFRLLKEKKFLYLLNTIHVIAIKKFFQLESDQI